MRRLIPFLVLVALPRFAAAQCMRGLEVQESIITNTGALQPKAAWADFDSDGRLDAFVYNGLDSYVLLNRGGVFVPLSRTARDSSFKMIYDQTRDGRADLISRPSPSRLRIEPGKGDGTFSAPIETELPSSSAIVKSTFADLDGDGLLDVVDVGDNSVRFVRGTSGGRFAEIATRAAARPADYGNPVIGDFDGDGRVDVLTYTGDGNKHTRTLRFFWSDASYELTSRRHPSPRLTCRET